MNPNEQPIAALTKALSLESAAQAKLDEARRLRTEAELLHREWESRTEALNRLIRSRRYASEQPLHFVRDSQSTPFCGQEIRLLQNFIEIKARHAKLQGELIFSLSHTLRDGSNAALFGDATHVQAVVSALETSEVFTALKTKAEAFAKQRASELGNSIETEFAKHGAWCRENGATPPAPPSNDS